MNLEELETLHRLVGSYRSYVYLLPERESVLITFDSIAKHIKAILLAVEESYARKPEKSFYAIWCNDLAYAIEHYLTGKYQGYYALWHDKKVIADGLSGDTDARILAWRDSERRLTKGLVKE